MSQKIIKLDKCSNEFEVSELTKMSQNFGNIGIIEIFLAYFDLFLSLEPVANVVDLYFSVSQLILQVYCAI